MELSEADLKAGNRTINYAGTEKPGEPYDNETDNYRQDHYQLFFNHQLSEKLSFQYCLVSIPKEKAIMNNTKPIKHMLIIICLILSTELILLQLLIWSVNFGWIMIFMEIFFPCNTKTIKHRSTLGGGYNRYDGNHFGKVIWAANGFTSYQRKWYDLDALKTDFNIYFKQQTKFAVQLVSVSMICNTGM